MMSRILPGRRDQPSVRQYPGLLPGYIGFASSNSGVLEIMDRKTQLCRKSIINLSYIYVNKRLKESTNRSSLCAFRCKPQCIERCFASATLSVRRLDMILWFEKLVGSL
jgi:hypothetical protein